MLRGVCPEEQHTSWPKARPFRLTRYSPEAVIKNFPSELTHYEKSEILQYKDIFYWGENIYHRCLSAKRPAYTVNPATVYDDPNGDYRARLHDHIAYRWEILESLGKGSFGQVFRARDYATNENVAIKIIRNKRRFTNQGAIEIRMLTYLNEWNKNSDFHCVKMLNHFTFRNHLCIVFELLHQNLFELIKSNDFAGFDLPVVQDFSRQILCCLKLLYEKQMLHCDLKPENILLAAPGSQAVRVIDFGSGCMLSQKTYTYIQSRFYRSPEIILGAPYDMAIDMWSFGCLAVELATGIPIFPGENEKDQLWRMMEVLGVPDEDLLNKSSKKALLLGPEFGPGNYNVHYEDSKGRVRKILARPLLNLANEFSIDFYGFVEGCLRWNPAKRFTPEQALAHSFLRERSSLSSYQLRGRQRTLQATSSVQLNSAGVHRDSQSNLRTGADASLQCHQISYHMNSARSVAGGANAAPILISSHGNGRPNARMNVVQNNDNDSKVGNNNNISSLNGKPVLPPISVIGPLTEPPPAATRQAYTVKQRPSFVPGRAMVTRSVAAINGSRPWSLDVSQRMSAVGHRPAFQELTSAYSTRSKVNRPHV